MPSKRILEGGTASGAVRHAHPHALMAGSGIAAAGASAAPAPEYNFSLLE